MSHAFLSTVTAVAGEELRMLWRKTGRHNRLFLLLLLTLAATFVSLQQKQSAEAERNRLQSTADQHWNAQPDRHPHRVVHYGHFVFSPMDALSFFDFGVEPYTGHAIYLEGHRQNSANFSDARQSSLLLRLGNLTPAFVLQTLVPLMIIFLAFGSVARARRRTNAPGLCQGVSGIRLLLGKVASHLLVALALSAPAFIAVAAISITGQGRRSRHC
jgi:ABC-2 type transport system permease protein